MTKTEIYHILVDKKTHNTAITQEEWNEALKHFSQEELDSMTFFNYTKFACSCFKGLSTKLKQTDTR